MNPVDPYPGTGSLKAPGFNPSLSLKCDILVSKFSFKFNLYRYATGGPGQGEAGVHGGGGDVRRGRAPRRRRRVEQTGEQNVWQKIEKSKKILFVRRDGG